jgi:hypothetical protein
MKQAKIVIIGTVAIAVFSAIAVFAVPIPYSWDDSAVLFYSLLSMSAALAMLHIGAVVLFSMSLSAYKLQMRRAYIFICLSITLLALGTAQLPVISALNLWPSAWVTEGGIGLPFVLAGATAYFGVRSLAVLVGMKNWLTRIWIAIPMITLLCALTAFLPHVQSNTPEASYDIAVAILTWSALAYLVAVTMLVRVRQQIGAHYTEAMAWLLLGFMASSTAMSLAAMSTLFSNKNQDGWSVAINCVGVISGCIFLRAAQVFMKAKEY